MVISEQGNKDKDKNRKKTYRTINNYNKYDRDGQAEPTRWSKLSQAELVLTRTQRRHGRKIRMDMDSQPNRTDTYGEQKKEESTNIMGKEWKNTCSYLRRKYKDVS